MSRTLADFGVDDIPPSLTTAEKQATLEHVLQSRSGVFHPAAAETEGMEAQPFSTTPEAVAASIVRGLERNDEMVWSPAVLRYVFAIMRHLPRGVWRFVSARS